MAGINSFNVADFNCNEVPEDWGLYGDAMSSLLNRYLYCIYRFLGDNGESLPMDIQNKLNELSDELTEAHSVASTNLTTLVNALTVAPLNCLDKKLYTTYITSFNKFKSIGQEIGLLLTTGGDAIGYDLNVGVDTTVIYPASGSTATKVTKCTGVYMKQMDFGSEFIGTVTVMAGVEEEAYFGEWGGLAKPYDGEWVIRN